MRWLALVAVLLSGCILEPGLESSTTKCPVSEPLQDGFRLEVEDPGRLVGRCVAIAHDGDGSDEDFALRRLGADGVAYLPVEGAGRYYLSVSVRDEDDKYCATDVGEFADHAGLGVVIVKGSPQGVCA